MTFSYEPATAADLAAIRALLAEAHLPIDDLGLPHQRFIVARNGANVVGCIGLERYGDDALLRSLAVAPARRGAGIGKGLHAEALAEARRGGVAALYLLTNTAEGLFSRFGFSRIARAAVPAAVAGSPEFRSLCPASAVCMVKRLSP
jgi:N-acetylglutamate synthase-like GNAT family acetyltransferase